MLFQRFRNDAGYLLEGMAAFHRHGYLDPYLVVADRPVDDLSAEKVAIGHYDLGAVLGHHFAGPDTDVANDAFLSVELDIIPDLEGPLEDKDDARNEVVDDVLQ